MHFADMMKLKILRWGDQLGLLGWAQYNPHVLRRGRRRPGSQGEKSNVNTPMGMMRPRAKEPGRLLDAGKGRRETREHGPRSADALILAQ